MGTYDAVIEKRSPCHFAAALNGRDLGTHRSEQAARAAITAAMLAWYGLVPANDERP